MDLGSQWLCRIIKNDSLHYALQMQNNGQYCGAMNPLYYISLMNVNFGSHVLIWL